MDLHGGTVVPVVPLNWSVRVIWCFILRSSHHRPYKGYVLASHKPSISNMSSRASYIATGECVTNERIVYKDNMASKAGRWYCKFPVFSSRVPLSGGGIVLSQRHRSDSQKKLRMGSSCRLGLAGSIDFEND